ncbi:pilus assembly protein [Nocardioides sp. J2M5]|uniref:TadE/TadG family type IV pilus assembly protein n=1 Tax=Nocardioides palaemonis TaxID=2829810 RepID=UPI001BA4A8C5|nr:TadE/TadG family type IV pilus assembly protein [Nocardioides palaemonis]MBS2938505.1 pilus assembly protein [Nocardioides palaemonis]
MNPLTRTIAVCGRRTRGDRGSAAIEAAVGVPAFALFVSLIILGGRTATAHQALESAAADAARTASISRTAASATESARAAAEASLENQGLRCTDVDVNVDTAAFSRSVGVDTTVGVTVTCKFTIADLGIPGVPGSRVLRATVTSPLDTWRERTP